MAVPVVAPPPAIVAPAPPRTEAAVVRAKQATREDALRADLARQAGLLKAAETTAEATKEAAETAANTAWYAALFALVGALFAAIVGWRTGWLATRTAQQIKHADYRQEWIDRLREEMARFTRLASENDGSLAKDAVIKESLSAIVLRMDKDDPDYDELLTLMGAVADKSKAKGEASDAIIDFLRVSQRILKREWEVTKADMHGTPWGRPWIWIANWMRQRRRAEEKEIIRRKRAGEPELPTKTLATGGKLILVWKSRQKPPHPSGTPVFKFGRLQLRHSIDDPTDAVNLSNDQQATPEASPR